MPDKYHVDLMQKAGQWLECCLLFSEDGALVLCELSWALRSHDHHSLCSFSQAPYVKVYLLDNGVCIAKKKTKVARKTLEPLYQQLLSFEESPQGKVLQVCTQG